MGNLKRKLLIITGGSAGIGKATIAKFLENDYRVCNLSRSPCALPGVQNFCVDLASTESILAAKDALRKEIQGGESTTVVHNAGTLVHDQIGAQDLELARRVFDINLMAAMALNNVCVPVMPPGSSIVYIGSTLSEKAVPHRASYVISKHAVIGLMRCTAQDLAEKSIFTFCVCPGFTDTQIFGEHVDRSALSKLMQEKVLSGRLIQPSELGELIFNLNQSAVINGSVIHANLGQRES